MQPSESIHGISTALPPPQVTLLEATLIQHHAVRRLSFPQSSSRNTMLHKFLLYTRDASNLNNPTRSPSASKRRFQGIDFQLQPCIKEPGHPSLSARGKKRYSVVLLSSISPNICVFLHVSVYHLQLFSCAGPGFFIVRFLSRVYFHSFSLASATKRRFIGMSSSGVRRCQLTLQIGSGLKLAWPDLTHCPNSLGASPAMELISYYCQSI
jgi:hypothetical protein